MILKSPNQIINQLETIQKTFLGKNYSLKIKHENICKSYMKTASSNVDISIYVVNLLVFNPPG